MKRTTVLIVAVVLSLSVMLGLMMFRVGGENDTDALIDSFNNTEYTIKRPISVEEVRREVSKMNGMDDASSDGYGYSNPYNPNPPGTGGGSGESGAGGGMSQHGHIYFKQSNYDNVIAGGTKISGGGCGWCSLTAATDYLSGSNTTPVQFLSIVSSKTKNYWSGGSMAWGAVPSWVEDINKNGSFGTYKVGQSKTGTSGNTEECLKIVASNAGSDSKCVILSANKGLFTGGGHIIVAVDLVEQNDMIYMHVVDSSGVASKNLGINYDEAADYLFPIFNKKTGKYITSIQTPSGTQYYNLKCAWTIEKQ